MESYAKTFEISIVISLQEKKKHSMQKKRNKQEVKTPTKIGGKKRYEIPRKTVSAT